MVIQPESSPVFLHVYPCAVRGVQPYILRPSPRRLGETLGCRCNCLQFCYHLECRHVFVYCLYLGVHLFILVQLILLFASISSVADSNTCSNILVANVLSISAACVYPSRTNALWRNGLRRTTFSAPSSGGFGK